MFLKKMLFGLVICAQITYSSANFNGDGTFYGDGGHGAEGACMLERGFNGIPITVAINQDQWENGGACGKCVIVQSSSEGLGMTPIVESFKATIDNLCPECHHGDIDIGLNGDGRWKINWDFVPCN
jgi:hypothetical protein